MQPRRPAPAAVATAEALAAASAAVVAEASTAAVVVVDTQAADTAKLHRNLNRKGLRTNPQPFLFFV
jgi:hypothetical protein